MIVGINLDYIMGRKYNPPEGNIRIDNQTKITNLEDINVPLFKEKATKVSFTFQTTYKTDKKTIGEIEISGNLLLRGDREKIREKWKEEKKLPDDIALNVMNNILRKSITRAIELSENLMLPPTDQPATNQAKKRKQYRIYRINQRKQIM